MPTKVLFIESGPGNGGSAVSLYRLVKSLDRAQYEPHIVVFHQAPVFADIAALGIPVTTLRPCPLIFGTRRAERTLVDRARSYVTFYGNLLADTVYNGWHIARCIRQSHIDIVHLNNGLIENLCAAFAARVAGVPCVSHVRGTEQLTRIERSVTNWLTAVITLNGTMRDHYARAFGAEKVHLIYNGVDLDSFAQPDPQRVRAEFDIRPQTFAVGTFARVVDGKGIPEFIAIAERVCSAEPHSRFFVVGSDSAPDRAFETRMRQLVDRTTLGKRFVFTGWRDDRINLMAAMDLVLQISTTFPEGMSLAPLEAMALSKPIIVTRIPGYEFCVDEGISGFVVDPGDVEAIAQHVITLAHDRERAQRMGRAGYQKALRQFDVRLTAQRVQEVYNHVLGPRSPTNSGALPEPSV